MGVNHNGQEIPFDLFRLFNVADGVCMFCKRAPVTEKDSVDGNGIKTVSVNYRNVHLVVEKGTSNQLEVELDTYERGPELSVNKNGDHVDVVAEGGSSNWVSSKWAVFRGNPQR